MHEAVAPPAWVMVAYLISGICFILALRGLSNPETARRGNRAGILGMALALATTLIHYMPVRDEEFPLQWHEPVHWDNLMLIGGAILIGAVIGLVTARRIAMTAMPQLVAAFHSLVGLAAVLVAGAAYLNPDAFGIAVDGLIHPVSRVEMSLGAAIGAVTFSGSVIAFLK